MVVRFIAAHVVDQARAPNSPLGSGYLFLPLPHRDYLSLLDVLGDPTRKQIEERACKLVLTRVLRRGMDRIRVDHAATQARGVPAFPARQQ